MKKYLWTSSAPVVTGALRVKISQMLYMHSNGDSIQTPVNMHYYNFMTQIERSCLTSEEKVLMNAHGDFKAMHQGRDTSMANE